MMPKVKVTATFKIQSIFQDFPEEFMKSSNNELNCNLCSCTISCNKRFLVESYRNTSKHQKALGSKSKLLIPLISQTFSKSSKTNFVEKAIKAFLLLIFLCTS